VKLPSGVTLDGDAKSQLALLAVGIEALAAKVEGKPYSVEWVAADNAKVTLSGNDVLTATSLLVSRSAETVMDARAKKDELAKAMTPDAARDAIITKPDVKPEVKPAPKKG
jgi:hypothetical protein